MANWTPVIESSGLANATIELIKSENVRLKEIAKKQFDIEAKILNKGIENIIQTYMYEEVLRGKGLSYLDEVLNSTLGDDWVDAGRKLNIEDTGFLGKFMETDIFGMSGNSDPQSDARGKSKGTKDLQLAVELKAMLNEQGAIHIGDISVLQSFMNNITEERDRIEYKNNLVLYKMLIKMRNFMLAKGEAQFNEKGNTYIKFNSFTVYSKLIVEYIEEIIENWSQIEMLKVGLGKTKNKDEKEVIKKKIKGLEIQNTPFKIREISVPAKTSKNGDVSLPLYTYVLKINYEIFSRQNQNKIDGEWMDVENSRKMYKERADLFNTPATRAKFYAVARHLASLAVLEVE